MGVTMRFFAVFLIAGLLAGCGMSPPTYSGSYGGYGGHTYITGPRGGCYFINSHGNKTYVDHSFCY